MEDTEVFLESRRLNTHQKFIIFDENFRLSRSKIVKSVFAINKADVRLILKQIDSSK